jgi:hypothetical protein
MLASEFCLINRRVCRQWRFGRVFWFTMEGDCPWLCAPAQKSGATSRSSEAGRSDERFGATVRDRIGKTREMPEPLERAKAVGTRSAAPYRPAAVNGRKNRPDTRKHLNLRV